MSGHQHVWSWPSWSYKRCACGFVQGIHCWPREYDPPRLLRLRRLYRLCARLEWRLTRRARLAELFFEPRVSPLATMTMRR